MVDRPVESSCAQKAMLWASADHAQGNDTFSTPKIAPATPMQAWRKPSYHQESPEILPSLSLGRSSAEIPAAYANSKMSHSTSMPTNCGASTTSRIPNRAENKENLLSFSLSKYEKSFGMAIVPSSRRFYPPSRDSAMPPNGSLVLSSEEQTSVGVRVAEDSICHASSLPIKYDSGNGSAERNCTAGISTLPYSPAPGEVANDAFKLYAELFPSTSVLPERNMSTPMSGDVRSSPFIVQIDGKKQAPPETSRRKILTQGRYAHSKDSPGGGKKLKLSSNGDETTSKSFLLVKEEPVFENSFGKQELGSSEEAFSARVVSNWKDELGHCKETERRDLTVSNSLCVRSPLTTSEALGDHSVDVKPDKEYLKCSTLSKDIPLHASSLGLQAWERSQPLPCKLGAWESPVQGSPSVDPDWGKFLALSATPLNKVDAGCMLPFQQRFKNLQAFLKGCDEADQNEQLEGLRALPAASRNGYAVELETRAIRLSLEEGKELQRMRLLNVLGRASENSLEELGGTPHGPRLPVLGATSPLAHVS